MYSTENQKFFYRILKTLRSDYKSNDMRIKSKNGTILNDEGTLMEQWKNYFQELLYVNSKPSEDGEDGGGEGRGK